MAIGKGKMITVKRNASNRQLQTAIEDALPVAAKQPVTIALAKKLRGANDLETSRNIFNWVLTNIRYKKDGSNQIVRLPSGIIRTREGDCKSMSLLVAALLVNNGIVPKFVYTSYKDNDPTPSHIYVETKSGIILDVVWKRFNSEKQPKFKYKKIMDISYLSGLDGSCAGLGAAGRGRAKVRTFVKKGTSAVKTGVKKGAAALKKGAKKVGLGAGRNLFLLLLKNNVDGLATKLNSGNREKQVNLWKKVGGDGKVFAEAIRKGASKPAKKMGFLQKLKGLSTKKKLSGFGATDEPVSKETQSKIIALATSLGATLGSAVPAAGSAAGAGGGASLGAVIIAVLPILKEAVVKVPAAEALDPDSGGYSVPSGMEKADEEKETNPEAEATAAEAVDKQTGGATNASGGLLGGNNLLILGGIAAAAFFLMKKKK
jgi:hypothetical protein